MAAPQCPGFGKLNSGDGRKPDYKMTDGPLPVPHRYFELIASHMKELPIDPARVYVTGYSMGAYASFECVIRRP